MAKAAVTSTLTPELQVKKKALDKIVAALNLKRFKGELVVTNAGDTPRIKRASSPTGSILFDATLGIGGWPKGCQVEIFGPEGGGKTTCMLLAMIQCQQRGGFCLLIDNEGSFDPDYFVMLGGNLEQLYIAQPDFGEDQMEVAHELIESGLVDMCGIDSVANIMTKQEAEGEFGDANMGKRGLLTGQAARKFQAVVNRHRHLTVIWINQVRDVMGNGKSYETTPGGRAIRFNCHLRVRISSGGDEKTQTTAKSLEKSTGREIVPIKMKVYKTRFGKKFKEAETFFALGHGFCNDWEFIQTAIEVGVIQGGAWKKWTSKAGKAYTWQNEVDLVSKMKEPHPEDWAELEKQVFDTLYQRLDEEPEIPIAPLAEDVPHIDEFDDQFAEDGFIDLEETHMFATN